MRSLPRFLCFVAGLMTAATIFAAEDTKRFDYAINTPFEMKAIRSETRGNATVLDITFIGTKYPIKAYLVTPLTVKSGGHAAILYVHWFGEPATTNRTEFLDEAVAMASHGVVSLLVDTMWSKPDWWKGRTPETDFAGGENQVVELRRALDLLLSQPGVDQQRVAVVAHDFGAMFSAVMGAVDQRPKAYVFLAPTPRLSDWYLFNVKPADVDAYKQSLAPLDPILAVPHLAPASVFYQFASKDKYVPLPRPMEFYDATTPRKHMATYDSDHDLSGADVRADRIAWLVQELKL